MSTPSAHGRRWRQRVRRAARLPLLVVTLLVVGMLAAVFAVNLLGISLLGDVSAWQHWQQRHGGDFLAWRLVLYAATVRGWWWMRTRLLQREPAVEVRRRLRRAEGAALAAIALMEIIALASAI